MPGPEYLRRSPSGAGVFRTADGSELEVDIDASPYARELMARPPEPRVDAQAEAARIIEEADVAARAARPVHAPRYTETGSVMADPGALIDLSGEPAQPPPGPADIPADWLSQAHLGEQPTDMQLAARGLLSADAAMQQPPAQPGVLAPDQVTMSPLTADPRTEFHRPTAADYARGAAAVTDYTGAAGAAGAPRPRVGHAGGRGGPQQPAGPPTLDQLMVPGGAAGPGLYGAMIDEAAGGPSGLREQERLGQWGTDIAGQRADIAQQAASDAHDAIDEGERRRVELEQDRQNAMAQARQRYDRALQRVQSMQIDPARLYRSSGGFGAVGAALAVGLGAVGGAIAGDNGNSALPIIQSAIDRDIEAQRANLANAQSGLDGEFNLLGQMSQEFESREGAEQAARAAMLQQAEARAQELLAGVASDEVQLNGQALIGQLRQQWNAAQAAAVQAEQDRQMQRALQMAQLRRRSAEATRAERRAAGGGTARPEPVTVSQLNAYEQMRAQQIPDAQAAQLAGLPANFVLTGQAALTTEQRSALDALDSSLRGIEDTVPRAGDDIPGVGSFDGMMPNFLVGEQGRSLRQQLDNAIDLLGRLRSGAAISEGEEQRFARILGSSGTDEQLRRGLGMIRAELDNRLGRRGRVGSQGSELEAGSSGGRVVE